ncbi:YceI family protein [Croceimicrobium sp.]|uniref:YceI family protein n=1 Tax=Croceimicrobium sp. TaxID=2828340 RepID=UPI003BADAF7E
MKIAKQIFALSLATAMVACNNAPEANVQAEDAKQVDETKSAEAVTYAALTDADEISWRGYKTYSKDEHRGVIQVSEGNFKVKDGELVGGEFTIDMNSIQNSDVESDEYRAKLEGHLKSPDFFAVDSFPTATFVITEVNPADAAVESGATHNITGNLTLRGVTKSVTFGAKVSIDENNVSLTASNIIIDRSQWNVRFRSTSFAQFADIAKEEAIDNSIELNLNIQGAKS